MDSASAATVPMSFCMMGLLGTPPEGLGPVGLVTTTPLLWHRPVTQR